MITRPTDWSTPITDDDVPEEGAPLSREWLVTNGLGGFASGTIPGIPTRRYHGLLVAALPAPLGRTLMLNHLREQLTTADGITVSLSEQETKNHKADLSGFRCLQSFHLEMGLPVWRYETGGVVWEKKIISSLPAEYGSYTLSTDFRPISRASDIASGSPFSSPGSVSGPDVRACKGLCAERTRGFL